MKNPIAGLVFLPFAMLFWVIISAVFATGLAATAALLWADDLLVRLRTRLMRRTGPLPPPVP